MGGGGGGVGADVISRGVRVHQQPCHMLLGGSVMRTEMHGSFTEHRGSRLAPPSDRVGGDTVMREGFVCFGFFFKLDFSSQEQVLCESLRALFYVTQTETTVLF